MAFVPHFVSLYREHIKQDMHRLQSTVGSQMGRGSSTVDSHTTAGSLQEVKKKEVVYIAPNPDHQHPNSLNQGGEIIDRERVALATESASECASWDGCHLTPTFASPSPLQNW